VPPRGRFERAVDEVAATSPALLEALVTGAPPRKREPAPGIMITPSLT